METRIPFSGFYETIWSSEIDEITNREVDNLKKEYEELRALEDSVVWEALYHHASYGMIFDRVAEDYARHFMNFINANYDLDLRLRYNALTSPREYNFETDRIFVDISYEDAKLLLKRVGWPALCKAAERMFTSRDGFISFYHSNPADWGKLRHWDHNHLYALFTALLADDENEDFDWLIFEDMNDQIYSAVTENIDYDAAIGDLHHKLDVENNEAEEDARKFPPNGTRMSTANYVKQYIELNNLRTEGQ